MAVASSAMCFVLALIVFLITFAFGSRALEIARLTPGSALDHVLFSSGAGFAALQLFLGIIALLSGLTLRAVIALLVLMAIAAGSKWKSSPSTGQECWKDLSGVFESSAAKALGICTLFFAGLEALISTAPLTGSDALHYHFTAPLLQIGRPEQPIFWLTHAFLTGLGHELIGMGLVLGGDKLSLLLIFLGGFLTAAALFQFARKFMPVNWALAAVLTFLMTPMVFWQISTAGSPDIWMGFYSLLSVLALERMSVASSRSWLVLASLFAGAGASIKYTGWILPAVLVLMVLWWTRSFLWATLCSVAALITGALPLLRNFLWTGDPFFPFLDRWIGKIAMNPYGMKMLQADIHAHSFSPQPLHIFYFLATMALRGLDYGLGNYFGPVVLAFLPLLFFCDWRARLTWVAAALWLSMLLANAVTTQMARFLLPAYPLALGLVISGAAAASRKGGAIVRFGCAATLVLFGLFCIASDTLYARDFLPVSVGLESRETFLKRMAPEYQTVMFVNSSLAQREGNALLFVRHFYYARVPFMSGDPNSSWIMNPDVLTSPQALHDFFAAHDIRWVVKSPDYPEPLAGVFNECEKEGMLIPEAKTEVETLTGASRVFNERKKVPVVLLRVARL